MLLCLCLFKALIHRMVIFEYSHLPDLAPEQLGKDTVQVLQVPIITGVEMRY